MQIQNIYLFVLFKTRDASQRPEVRKEMITMNNN